MMKKVLRTRALRSLLAAAPLALVVGACGDDPTGDPGGPSPEAEGGIDPGTDGGGDPADGGGGGGAGLACTGADCPALLKKISTFTDVSGSSSPHLFTVVGTGAAARAYFVANDLRNGQELWTSDGTVAGTHIVKDLSPGHSDTDFTALAAVGTTLYFVADDGVHGLELWKSDGTPAGTTLVKDLAPGAPGSNPAKLTAVGDKLFFSATDPSDVVTRLFVTDGTSAGTLALPVTSPAT